MTQIFHFIEYWAFGSIVEQFSCLRPSYIPILNSSSVIEYIYNTVQLKVLHRLFKLQSSFLCVRIKKAGEVQVTCRPVLTSVWVKQLVEACTAVLFAAFFIDFYAGFCTGPTCKNSLCGFSHQSQSLSFNTYCRQEIKRWSLFTFNVV